MRRSAGSPVTGYSIACGALAPAVALLLLAAAAAQAQDASFKVFGATYSQASDERVELLVRNCELGRLTGRLSVFLITGEGPKVEVASEFLEIGPGVYVVRELPLPLPDGGRTAGYVEIQAAPGPCTVPGNPPALATLAVMGPTGDTRLLLKLEPVFVVSYSTGGTDGAAGRDKGFGFIRVGTDETLEAVIHDTCGSSADPAVRSEITYTIVVQNVGIDLPTETIVEVPAEWGAKVALNGAQAGWNIIRAESSREDGFLNSPCRPADIDITVLSANSAGETQSAFLLPAIQKVREP